MPFTGGIWLNRPRGKRKFYPARVAGPAKWYRVYGLMDEAGRAEAMVEIDVLYETKMTFPKKCKNPQRDTHVRPRLVSIYSQDLVDLLIDTSKLGPKPPLRKLEEIYPS